MNMPWNNNETENPDNSKSVYRDEQLAIGYPYIQHALIASKWSKALIAEGFGYVNTKDNKVDVSNETSNMYDMKKLMVWIQSNESDFTMRKQLLASYIKPYFSNKSLNRSLLPVDSFVSDIIDTLSVLYTSEVKRYITSDPNATSFIQQIVDDGNINAKLLQAQRLLKYVNSCAIKVVRRNDAIELDIYDPTEYRVLYNNNNELIKVLYSGEIYHTNGTREEVIYVYTSDQFYYVNHKGIRFALPENPDAVNPYGVIPFVICQLKDGDLFSGYDMDLVTRNMNHNFYKLLTNDDATVSTRSLTMFQNIDLPDNAIVSNQDCFISMSRSAEEKGDIRIVSGEMHFQELAKLYQDEKKSAGLERGIPSFYLENNFRELNSAKALKIQMKRFIDSINKDIPVFRSIEKRLWKIIATVANIESKAKRYTLANPIDPTVFKKMVIDYADMLADYNDTDALQLWMLQKQQIQSNVLGVSDIVRYYNNDINTKEEALETLRNNKKENAEFMTDDLTDLFDLIGGNNETKQV